MNPANALTLLSVASATCGLLALNALDGAAATAAAVTCICASLLLDRADGAVARRLGLTSPIGERLDSLADLLAFGLLPAVLVATRHPGLPIAACALAYVLTAVWRLARYDADELADGRFGPAFKGWPTPSAAALTAIAVTVGDRVPGPWIEGATLLAMAALMPSNVRYPKRGIGVWVWILSLPVVVLVQWWSAWGA